MSVLLRVYEPEECGPDGYPAAWSCCPECGGVGRVNSVTVQSEGTAVMAVVEVRGDGEGVVGRALHFVCPACEGAGSIKQMVRVRAGERCVRCQHPFRVGESGVYELKDGRRSVADLDLNNGRLPDALWEDEEVAAAGKRRGVVWSACDERCTHGGRVRWPNGEGGWFEEQDVSSAGRWLLWDRGAELQAAWQILTVHHLTGEKRDCRWWNLVPLCQKCHLVVQRKVVMDRIWPWPHSEWFKPYVAGFYANRYLCRVCGKQERDAGHVPKPSFYGYVSEERLLTGHEFTPGFEITREEAERRMDELLAYERVA